MTTRSITYEQAVEQTRKYLVALARTSDTLHSPKGVHEDGGLLAQHLTMRGVRQIQDEPDQIIADARRDAEAFDALRFGAAQQIALQQPLPIQISNWIALYLQGRKERPLARSGRPSKMGMDIQIHFLVSDLVEKGLSATRNDAPSGGRVGERSACDAVAEALAAVGLSPSSYDRVKSIYLEMRQQVGSDGGSRVKVR